MAAAWKAVFVHTNEGDSWRKQPVGLEPCARAMCRSHRRSRLSKQNVYFATQMPCQQPPAGSRCGAHPNNFEQVDLSPPADCLDDLSQLQFSSLASTGTAQELTCDRPTGGPAKPANATWPHCIRGVRSSRQLHFADIGIGMPTYLKRAHVGERALYDATAMCLQGVLLACARITWMQSAGPALEVLMLMDCLTICEKRGSTGEAARHACQPVEEVRPGDESRQFIAKHGRFIYSTPRWLESSEQSPSATVHLFCSWQEYFERRSYRKTGLLLHLMHTTMPVCIAQAAESTRPALGNSHACRALALFGL